MADTRTTYIIRSRSDGAPLYSTDATSLADALRQAVSEGAALTGADLRDADLRDADLEGAALAGAWLGGSRLRGAYLYGAILTRADMYRVDLSGTILTHADLQGANLNRANISDSHLLGSRPSGSTILPTGESLEEYRRVVVPALLAAGAHEVSDAAWSCHTWLGRRGVACPMAESFGVDRLSDIPRLHRPRVEQFTQLYDADWPVRPAIAGQEKA